MPRQSARLWPSGRTSALESNTFIPTGPPAAYHITFNKLKVEGKCDACGGDLLQRADDTESTVKQRLNACHAQTQPIIDYYKKKSLVATAHDVGDIKQNCYNSFKRI